MELIFLRFLSETATFGSQPKNIENNPMQSSKVFAGGVPEA